MGLFRYILSILKLAISQSFGRSDTISGFTSAILYGIGKLFKLEVIMTIDWWWLPLIVLGAIFAIRLLLSPYWIHKKIVDERDEYHRQVEQLSVPLGISVNAAIQQLQEEKPKLKNNNGEERLYSFAEVLLAIRDQLSSGISSIHFESKIRKGLSIDEKGGWYFPYEDEGITHLIGVLTQNDLVDPHIDPYERMVTDYPRPNPFGVIDNTVYVTPSQHLEKGTDTTYYLSSFGRSVLKQLRQQSIAHKEGSKNEL